MSGDWKMSALFNYLLWSSCFNKILYFEWSFRTLCQAFRFGLTPSCAQPKRNFRPIVVLRNFLQAKTIPFGWFFHRPNNFTWNRICIRQLLSQRAFLLKPKRKGNKNPSSIKDILTINNLWENLIWKSMKLLLAYLEGKETSIFYYLMSG